MNDDVWLIDAGRQPQEASGFALEMEREYCRKYGTPKCACWDPDNSRGHNVGMCFYAFNSRGPLVPLALWPPTAGIEGLQ